MTDLRLRDELERESHRISLHPGAAERMFERRTSRRRRMARPWSGWAWPVPSSHS
jgi:hypothetical protein